MKNFILEILKHELLRRNNNIFFIKIFYNFKKIYYCILFVFKIINNF